MSIKISFTRSNLRKISANTVLFVDEKFNLKTLKKYVSKFEFSYISDLLKTSDLSKKLLIFDLNSKKKIILVSVKKNIRNSEIESLGAQFFKHISHGKNHKFYINSDSILDNNQNFIGYFLHGLKLKSYDFKKYKSKKEKKSIVITVFGNKNKYSSSRHIKFLALEEGTFFARDLVSEPGNILHPDEYAKRINSLKRYGLKVNIYDQKKLKKLGMNALLGVGQ